MTSGVELQELLMLKMHYNSSPRNETAAKPKTCGFFPGRAQIFTAIFGCSAHCARSCGYAMIPLISAFTARRRKSPRAPGSRAARVCRPPAGFERPGEEGAQAVRLRRSRPKGHPDPWAVLDGRAAGKLSASIIREEEVCIWMRSVSASF